MEVIRDWKQLKTIVDNTYTYSCIGFTRGSRLFDFTHEYMYKFCLGKADKLFGTVWDNYYDAYVFLNIDATIATYDDDKVVNWFIEKGFDYLFIPDQSFIHELLEDEMFKIIRHEVDDIWINDGYEKFIGNWVLAGNTSWVKLLFSRHYLLFSDRSGSKFVNRIYQPLAPDGTWGYLYRSFFTKYCGGTYEMFPILRNENGLAYDPSMVDYPTYIIDLFIKTVPLFNKFRENNNIKSLTNSMNSIFVDSDFNLESLAHFNEDMTLNKDIFLIIINNKIDVNLKFRMWEYGNGV